MIDTADDVAKDAKQADSVTMSDGEQFASAFYSDAPKAPEMHAEDKSFVDDTAKKMEASVAPPAPKPMSFKQAFAAARKAGDSVFEFNGKKYTTQLASEAKPASKPVAKPVVSAKEASKPAIESAPMSMESAKGKVPAPQTERPSVYADNFINDGINKIKAKLNERGTGDTLPNGKPNLTK